MTEASHGSSFRTLESLVTEEDLKGKRVLIRVDFNVPLEEGPGGLQVGDDTRIRAALPTLKRLLNAGATLFLVSHLGRPKGAPEDAYRMDPVAARLSQLLGAEVRYQATDGPAGAQQQRFVAAAPAGSVTLLENSRFDSRETKNDPAMARVLASYADYYVNDAFGAAHRAHATTEAVARLLPSAAGQLMTAELQALKRLTDQPDRPFVVVLGGAKVSDKLGVIESLLSQADAIIIGGAMAYTFELAKGGSVGGSLVEPDLADTAERILASAEERGVKLLLPPDSVCAQSIAAGVETRVFPSGAIPDGWLGLDVGPRAVELFSRELAGARTVFWNGPLGVFETAPFDAGTTAIAKVVAGLDAYTVVGGGDSIAALTATGLQDQIDHVSTGGGASLEFVEGVALPGVTALEAN
ncbi:MAG: phosphoglycerate kinase [Trueperaceae bacterium]